MKWLIRGYALILLIYTGYRTFDFMRAQLPTGETGYVLALLFLFSTEVGLIMWHEISLRYTTTQEQHYVAITMTWVDFAASLAAGIADMILRQNVMAGYQIPPMLGTILIYGMPLVMALNVAAVLFFQYHDSESQIERARRELRHEIHRQALKELTNSAGSVAASIKKDVARQLRDDVTGGYLKERNVKLLSDTTGTPEPEINPTKQRKAKA